MEDIPKQNYRDLETSLNEIRGSKTEFFTRQLVTRKSGVSKSKVMVFLTDLCDRNILSAHIVIRCPYCDQHHGRFAQKSHVPNVHLTCFCGDEFDPQGRETWEVVYRIEEDGADFFPDLKTGLKQLMSSTDNLSPHFFHSSLKEIREIEDARERGRMFDYFVGLLFNQLESVDVYIGQSVPIGEIDVFVACLDAPNWLHRLVGEATLIENKWTKNPVQTREISVFHDKVQSAPVDCKLSYFVSMTGFTESGEMSAKQLIRAKDEPKVVGLEGEDVEKMVSDGTPKPLMRNRVMR